MQSGFEIFNIGPLELLFIVVLALLILGPQDMVKTARSIGKLIRKVVRSPLWNEFMQTSQEIRSLPTKVIQEAGLDEIQADLQKASQQLSREVNETLNSPDLSIDLKSAGLEIKQSIKQAASEALPAASTDVIEVKPLDSADVKVKEG